jgi:hypothetical protein
VIFLKKLEFALLSLSMGVAVPFEGHESLFDYTIL